MRTYTPHIPALGLRMHRSSMQYGWRAAAAATAALWKIWVIRKRSQGRAGEVSRFVYLIKNHAGEMADRSLSRDVLQKIHLLFVS